MDGPGCIARMDELQRNYLEHSAELYFCRNTADFTLEETAELLGKALGSGLAAFALAQAQVLHTEDGAPYFAFSGALEQQMAAAGLQVLLSLTHEGGFATAFVVLVRQPPEEADDPS